MRQLTVERHREFIAIAHQFSRPLAEAMTTLGPLGYQRRKTRDLGVHLARIVVGQQLSTLAARSIWTRVEAAAAHAPRVLEFCVERSAIQLRECGLSNNKVKALIALRRAERDGRLDARQLERLDPAARSEALTALWGIGPWTADMVSMFYFHETDIWPLGDLAVRKTFEGFVRDHAHHTVTSAAELFAPHRSFLALYMWKIANNGPTE